MISIILPTYNEAENIARTIHAISAVLQEKGIRGEIIVVDDNSPDGTAKLAISLQASYPVRVIKRTSDRGLSRSVNRGFELAQGQICVVMDADLSHPVKKIPEMIQPILNGRCDATVGSRYVEGGGAQNWPLLRKMSSRMAGLLARGVTDLTDPTSGFMAIRKSTLEGIRLDPLGWKIVLEVVVKTRAKVLEVPIVFSDRQLGKSKLTYKAQWDYLRHLKRLYVFKYPRLFKLIGAGRLSPPDP
jgi:dolichol-phosphate mannosyltransferase